MTEQIKDMIEYCVERGDIVFELNGELWGICSGWEMTANSNQKKRTFWYFCDPKHRIVKEWGEFDTVDDIFNAKVFGGKSLIDLFATVDFSMN